MPPSSLGGSAVDSASDGGAGDDDGAPTPRRKYARRPQPFEEHELPMQAPGSARRFERDERSRERERERGARERERSYAADEEFYRGKGRNSESSASGYSYDAYGGHHRRD